MTFKRFIWLTVILFISINIFLVVNDKEGHIDRTAYIKDWTMATKTNMYQKLGTEGVLDYTTEQQVYLDQNSGSFQDFIAEEGDVIHVGDDLYTYKVQQYYEIKAGLDTRIETLQGEVLAVEEAIDKIRGTEIKQSTISFVYPDETEAANITQNTSEAEMMKEQYIIEREKELSQAKAQLASVESQLNDLITGEDTITVESPFAGKVTNISTSLDNPIITIEAHDLHIISELTEENRMLVEEGMQADITLTEAVEEDSLDVLTGVVHEISEEPDRLSLKGASVYPFYVIFDEGVDVDNLLQGYHTNLDITLQESIDAVTVNHDVVFDRFIWKMTPAGKLIKQPIEKGIHMDQLVEITVGANKSDWIAKASESKFRDRATFITPLDPDKATWKEMIKSGPRKRSLLIGLLGR